MRNKTLREYGNVHDVEYILFQLADVLKYGYLSEYAEENEERADSLRRLMSEVERSENL